MTVIEECPLGKECTREYGGKVFRCKWFIPFTTFPTPQHKEPVEMWKCAHVWLPNLIVEMLTMERQQMQQAQQSGIVKPYKPQ